MWKRHPLHNLWILLPVGWLPSPVNSFGVQSGPSRGSTYAGGMVFDESNNKLYVTGTTYDSSFGTASTETSSDDASCFLSAVDMNDWDWNNSFVFGSASVLESCQTVTLAKSSTLVLGGNSEIGGLYYSFSQMTGFVMLVDTSDISKVDDGLPIVTTYAEKKIPYPQWMTALDEDVYVISMVSSDAVESDYAQALLESEPSPNWIKTPKYGSFYDMGVSKFKLEQDTFLGLPSGTVMLADMWSKEFPVDDIATVHLGGAIVKNAEFLVVAGSVPGTGENNDEDGFILLLDLDSGDTLSDVTSSARLGTGKDDVVLGLCDNSHDSTSFFVVGSTLGNMADTSSGTVIPTEGSLQAWIAKFDVDTLERLWTVQIGAQNADIGTGMYAVGCTVVDDFVYVAGGVQDGAGVIVNGESVLQAHGGDDIWAAQIESSDGTISWVVQIGSNDGSETLSSHGGVGSDSIGNIVLFGETTGSLYRTRGDDDTVGRSDVFAMLVNADDGSYASMGQPVSAPTEAPVAPVDVTSATRASSGDFAALGVQIAGPLYAGGVVFDSTENRAVITGAGFDPDSQCYVATVNLANGEVETTVLFGSEGTAEACSAIDFDTNHDVAYVVGGTEKGGYLLDQLLDATSDSSQFAFTLQLRGGDSTLVGGGIYQDHVVSYPVAVSVDSSRESVYVAYMASENGDLTNTPTTEYPNYTSGGIRKYGSNYYPVVQKYSVETTDSTTIQKTLTSSWATSWTPDTDTTVFTSGMTMAGNGDILVIVGSTTAYGGPFGTNNEGNDMDGFIMKVDISTGELVSEERASTRLDSINGKDDWVTNVCADRLDNDAIYVVGATKGKVHGVADADQPPEGTIHSFIAKISLATLNASWLKHFTMQGVGDDVAQSSSFACAATFEGETSLVYVAGVIEEGATMEDADVAEGSANDDIFVAQLDGSDGTVRWMKQIGTSANERLAHGRGLDIDADGNAIVFGETGGSLWKTRAADRTSSEMDLIVFTMSKSDGSYKAFNGVGTSADDESDAPTEEPIPDAITAFQSASDVGPSYAGGMYYDSDADALYITGGTFGAFGGDTDQGASYASSCFFGSLVLPGLDWHQREIYGTDGVTEACSVLASTVLDGESTIIIAGSTEKGGLLEQLGSGSTATQYGILLDLASVNDQYTLQGGSLMDDSAVQFPVAILASEDGAVWTVSMTSTDNKVTADSDKVASDEYPNFTTGGIEKYGSHYEIVVERFELERSGDADGDSELQQSLQLTWRKPFEAAEKASIYVSGMIEVAGTLIVVGSTRGRATDEKMDGIMAKLSGKEGTFVIEESGASSVAYFSSVTDRDDWILNACKDPDDDAYFYIVGATQGTMEGSQRDNKDVTVHALVAKISVFSLQTEWTKQFSVSHANGSDSSKAAASIYGCAVIDGMNAMYVAGTVENGATVDVGSQVSAGRDDIFVAKLSTTDGSVDWLKQVGSNGDDRVAHGNGVAVDNNGNAVVFGDTNGSFFRSRADDGKSKTFSDLFVVIFNQDDGAHVSPLTESSSLPKDTSTPSEYYPGGGGSTPKITRKHVSISTLALIVVGLGAFFFLVRRRKARKRAERQKSSIFGYLQKFDVEDIDLRKSPPGGWHGTYLNKLSYGVNSAERGKFSDARPTMGSKYLDVYEDEFEMTPLSTHRTNVVVEDSLFMDKSSTPSLGYRNSGGSRQSLGLDDPYFDASPKSRYYDNDGF